MVDLPVTSRAIPYTDGMEQFHFYLNGSEVAEVVAEFICPFNGHIVDVLVDAETGPVTSDSIVDVHVNGTTIFTTQANRPTLPDGDTGFYTKAGEPEVTALREGDKILFEVDQIGSGTAATRQTILLIAQRHQRLVSIEMCSEEIYN